MTLVDGRSIAADIRTAVQKDIATCGRTLRLGIVACAPNFETKTYLDLKEKTAATLGVVVERVQLAAEVDTATVTAAVLALADRTDGVIVQLPLPEHIDREAVLAAVPREKDVDAFSYSGEVTEVLPPVIGAIQEISQRENVVWKGAHVVIFGSGKLVGQPARDFAQTTGAEVVVVTEATPAEEAAELATVADIIILGVGKPQLLTLAMVKDGVVVFDAGASEDGGVIVGDADPEIAIKASVFTPVPGGIGPITIALIFRNLLNLALRQ